MWPLTTALGLGPAQVPVASLPACLDSAAACDTVGFAHSLHWAPVLTWPAFGAAGRAGAAKEAAGTLAGAAVPAAVEAVGQLAVAAAVEAAAGHA